MEMNNTKADNILLYLALFSGLLAASLFIYGKVVSSAPLEVLANSIIASVFISMVFGAWSLSIINKEN